MTASRSAASVDVLVLGAGAAGLFCAAKAAARGGRVLAIDHAKAPGEKIRISGGGRCNFTNLRAAPENFICRNPHFVKSALSRYSAQDFVDLVAAHGVPFHEKTLGQLFCDNSARDIIDLLLAEMAAVGAELRLRRSIASVEKTADGFRVALTGDGGDETISARAVVVATGGKSIPKMGATGFGYRLAAQFGVPVVETRPGLVPLTFGGDALEGVKALAGVAADAVVRSTRAAFQEAVLFTHRGLSGPAILQISSYWREGEAISIDYAPGCDVAALLRAARAAAPKREAATALAEWLPKRLARRLTEEADLQQPLGRLSDKALAAFAARVSDWPLTPTGSEGYRTAEVTLGGVDTDALDGRTLEARSAPGLFFIGEVVDVTGWLGGYNFQWAWSSAYAAGDALAARFSG